MLFRKYFWRHSMLWWCIIEYVSGYKAVWNIRTTDDKNWNLYFHYDERQVLHDISVQLPQGSITGWLGRMVLVNRRWCDVWLVWRIRVVGRFFRWTACFRKSSRELCQIRLFAWYFWIAAGSYCFGMFDLCCQFAWGSREKFAWNSEWNCPTFGFGR